MRTSRYRITSYLDEEENKYEVVHTVRYIILHLDQLITEKIIESYRSTIHTK